MADLVRVRNLDDKPLKIAYNSQVMTIPAKGDGFVDREAAAIHFGVWWSVQGGRPIDRQQEYLRIKGLYGCFPGGPANEFALNWDDVKPKVEIYEPESGEKVSTVIEDPEGANIPVTQRDDDVHMRQMMEKMQEQLEDMQSKLDNSERIVAAHSAPILPPEDSPETAPTRKRTAARVEGAKLGEAVSE